MDIDDEIPLEKLKAPSLLRDPKNEHKRRKRMGYPVGTAPAAREAIKDGASRLTPIKPGQVLNPKGRPKGTLNMRTVVERFLTAEAHESQAYKVADVLGPGNIPPKGVSVLDVMVAVQAKRAMNGNLASFQELCNRVDGMPEQIIRHTSLADEDEAILAAMEGGQDAGIPRKTE